MASILATCPIVNNWTTANQVWVTYLILVPRQGAEADARAEQAVYDLVGKGLFSGYIDWQDDILYSRQARQLRGAGACPNCGGKLELAGKGIIKCPYCASDIFL